MGDPSSSAVKKDWEIEVDAFLKEEPLLLLPDAIYPVPECLKNGDTQKFYHPKEISFGPLHCQKKDFGSLKQLELMKSEVARKFNGRLEDGLSSVVKYLYDQKQEEIAKSYPFINMDRETLSWVLVRDGCFVLEVLERFLEDLRDDGKPEADGESVAEDDGKTKKSMLEHILNTKNHHPLLSDIVKDMFKLENQLPLWVLNEIRTKLPNQEDDCNKYDWFEYRLRNLSPVEVKGAVGTLKYSKRIHILQMLGEYMVDDMLDKKDSDSGHKHRNVVSLQRLTRRGFFVTTIFVLVFICVAIIYITLSAFFIIMFVWLLMSFMWQYRHYLLDRDEVVAEDGHVLPSGELVRLGVTFKNLDGKGISHIEFDESNSTLYLPKFRVSDSSEVILRNLMAMETHAEDSAKPIIRFVILLNDLVNTSDDVSILRRHGIITNCLGSDGDVARLWNSIGIPSTGIPSYEPIKLAAENLNRYKKKRLKTLWAQFKMAHCSKPWLVVSLLGGISLLLLTAVQVACLFQSCQIRK